ncbi:MAG TPA: protein kinase [Polyangia bacterium]|jgi:serine/threonine-protein kinase
MGAGKPTTPALDATLPFLNALDDAPAGAADPLIGARLKHFQVKKLLGKGGMGAVYLAEDTSLGRQVALKVLDRAVGADPEIVARFVREARAQAQLRHPNITQIYFIGEEGGVHFFAMEFLDGEPLDARLARGEVLPWDQAISVCEAAARGLAAALKEGFIHRDVKPSNLLVDGSGQVKLADFGLAKSVRGDAELTRAGMIVGSPLYMAPEQGRAEPVDHRSDIYSLGCTLYHLITGQPPFNSPSPVAVMSMHVTDRATRIRALRPEVPESVERLVDRMMSKDAAHRFADYDALLLAMESARPERRQHTGLVARAAAVGIDLALISAACLVLGAWGLLLGAAYFIVAHLQFGQTVGKWLLKLEVTDRDGHRIGWKAAAIRFGVFAWGPAACALLGGLAYALHRREHISFTVDKLTAARLWEPMLWLGLGAVVFLGWLGGFLLAAFHPHHYALHDLIAKTEVTYKIPPRRRS